MEEQSRILLVEDEEHLVDIILMNLELEGYKVLVAKDGLQGLEMLRSARFDLCILDVMLPGMDGFSVCRTIRREDISTPVLFLTAKNSGTDRVMGLKIGGDDYLSKPFNLEELLLRVEKLIQRKESGARGGANLKSYSFGGNHIDFQTYSIIGQNGEERELSQREIKLLKFLIENEEKVVSREAILEAIWGYDVFPSTRTIDNYIVAFRKYFEKDPRHPVHFHSIRGVGYKFTK